MGIEHNPVLAENPNAAFNVFLMMRFADSAANRKIVKSLRAGLHRYGMNLLRADQKAYSASLWENVKFYMNACNLGVARHKTYLEAVENAFGADIDYAQLQKIYGAVNENETRYSPAKCIGCDMNVVSGNLDPKHVATSYVERQNLSMRMSIRRFTRLTNAFSKKIENHAAAVAIWFMYYNFCRVHSTLRVTPAMEAGISDHVWSIEEMCDLVPKAVSATKQIDRNLLLNALGEKMS